MSRQYSPPKFCSLLVPAVLAACLGVTACEPPRSSLPASEDLVTGTAFSDAVPREVAFCGDETRYSLVLESGDELRATVPLEDAKRLVVRGCISRVWEGGEKGAGLLTVRVGPRESIEEDAASRSFAWQVPRHSKWWRQEGDLTGLAGPEIELRVSVDVPNGRKLYLEDFYLEGHRSLATHPVREEPLQALLISVDTLRADVLTVPGLAPHLQRFASEAETFAPHYATASWTKPSHGSLLTGFPPKVHGAYEEEASLRQGVPTLAEELAGAGFATGGLVSDCLWLDPRFGFDRGFEDYDSVEWSLPQMVRSSSRWMGQHRQQPFFFFLHTFEAHSDFNFLPFEGEGITRQHLAEQFPGRVESASQFGCRQGYCASGLLRAMDTQQLEPLPTESEVLHYLYRRGVARVDEALGALFQRLRDQGLYDRMLIIVTSDHGEMLLEHGATLHGKYWEPVVAVPLLIKWPHGRAAGQRRDDPTSALDLVPTLFEAAGIERDSLPGRSLHARVRSDRPVFSEGAWRVVVQGRLKLVDDRPRNRILLFDLANDPEELHDLAARRPDDVAKMMAFLDDRQRWEAARLEALDRQGEGSDRHTFSEEERRRLEALGYLGGQ